MRINYFVAGGFVVLIFFVIIFVTAILPATTFKPKPSAAAIVYTEQELRGRNIYRREGCFYCHSMFTRYQDREYGEMVTAGDYVNETPHILGTARTGPDLSNIGNNRYATDWHRAHHSYPRKVKPGSIMPNYSFLSKQDMDDLVAFLQTLGRQRNQPEWVTAPQELRDEFDAVKSHVDVNSSAAANAGRGIYMQNCAGCHGVTGRGNGPVSITMIKKPANFTRPFYKNYGDAMWYYRVKEGVAGTRMPRWGQTLGKEQMLYLVAFLKTLPKDSQAAGEEITSFQQLDDPVALSKNYNLIKQLGEQSPYGTGRPE
ncbi:MAG: cbb3-type cytochrome c oxidase subunit II [Cyanobacteria bacterium HKST-UBA04]|nr:cbb3-type cytochrome c oxidase subunit II [Cyanobacteria bacterium HKST-UBA04]MCA9840680.1 cbb3-type cytochrome c oxidase subunit II [Cyanobacteria bacterium HKST-UBA03]